MRNLVLAAALLTFVSHRADACGAFSMTDIEKGLTIKWLFNAASIEKGDVRWAALYLDTENASGLRVAQGHKVVFDIRGDSVVRYGKRIGRVNDDVVTFGVHTYAIELADHQVMDNIEHVWKLTVRRGDDVIITADRAAGLCSAMHGDPAGRQARARDEVRRRIIYYLAWRETGL